MEHLETLASPDLENKYQTANSTFVALAERFQPLEFDYHSFSLYAHDADASSLRTMDQDVRTTVIHTATVLSAEEMLVAQKGFQQSADHYAEVWQLWQTLISLLAELAVSCLFVLFPQRRIFTNIYCLSFIVDCHGRGGPARLLE